MSRAPSETPRPGGMRIPAGLEPYARTVELPGRRTSVFLYDAGPSALPAVLLIHGLGDEADSWRKVIGPLSQRHRVIAPDLPGFGRSPLPRRRLTPPYLARLLLDLLSALGIPRAAFVGSSLGASLAQLCALYAPDRVTRLVLSDGGLLVRSELHPALVMMLLPGFGERRYGALGRDLDAAYASLLPYYADLGGLPQEDREFLRARVGERVASATQKRAYFSLLRGFFLWMLFRGKKHAARAARLGVDTVYVWGLRDRIVALRAGQMAAAGHPGARLEVIPGAGHLPHQEAPAELLRLLQ